MTKPLLFSVLVPVYNVAPYLRECVDSVLGQSYQNFELLLVDDGSTDESGAICDEYAAKDARIRVFHKENGGLISARRYAVARFSGDYCIFLDSDASLAPNALEVLAKAVDDSEADCVLYGIRWNRPGRVEHILCPPEICGRLHTDKRDVLNILLNDDSFNSLCRKCVRASCFDGRDFSGFFHISRGEDRLQSVEILENARSFFFLPDELYVYRVNDSSITHTICYDGYQADDATSPFRKLLALCGELLALDLILMCILKPMETSQYLRWYGNTLTIALFVAVLQTVIVLSVSYALSRLRFRGRKMIMNVVLVLGLFPGFLTMITLYFLLKQLGMTGPGAIPGLILIYVASSGMGYYISKGFFDTIPKSLDESARIDGATRFQVFLKIIMPLAKPIVIYTILMAFMGPWGDYVFASYVAFGNVPNYNVAVGLYQWVNVNDYQGYFTRFCAGGVLVAVPITALFLALQKYYVEGVTGGAVKG